MPLDLISTSTGQPDTVANELFKALKPASIFGNRASTTAALTWGYYGGPFVDSGDALIDIADDTVVLAASDTNYVERDADGVVSVNQSGFTETPLYTVITGASGVTGDPVDHRAGVAGAGGGGGGTLPVADTTSIVEGSADATKELRIEVDGITTATVRVWTAQDVNLTVAGTDVQQAYTKNQRITPVTLTDGANIAVDAALSNNFKVTLGGNRTLDNPSNLADGMVLNFVIKQDGTGTRTLAYGTKYSFPGGTAPVLSTAASSKDFMSCYYDSGADELFCVMSKAFS